MALPEKSIGIFGGTFDPVHNGHVSIAESFLNSPFIEELWIFLSPFPPHKEDKEFSSYAQRYRMLETAFRPFDSVKVSDLELRLPKPSYTIQTVNYLTNKHSNYSFYLCMGMDSLLSFTSWHKWNEIIDECPLLVAERPGNDESKIHPGLNDVIYYVDHESIAISSTDIRQKIKNRQSIDHLLPASVASIIYKENLYQS